MGVVMSLPLPDPLIVTGRGNIAEEVADPHAVQRNFEALAALFPLHAQYIANDVLVLAVAGTARKVALGQGTASYSAAASSAVAVVSHGLGVAPVAYGAWDNGGVVWWSAWQAYAATSTQFSVQGHDVDNTARTGTASFSWVAIG